MAARKGRCIKALMHGRMVLSSSYHPPIMLMQPLGEHSVARHNWYHHIHHKDTTEASSREMPNGIWEDDGRMKAPSSHALSPLYIGLSGLP